MSTTNRTILVNELDLVTPEPVFISSPYPTIDFNPYPTFEIPLYSGTNFNSFDNFTSNPIVNSSVRDLRIKKFLKYESICTFSKKFVLDFRDGNIRIDVFNLPSFGLFNEKELDKIYLIEKINPFLSEYKDSCSLSSPYSSNVFSLYTLKNDKYNEVYYFINIKDSSILKDIESFRFEIFCLCEALLRILKKKNVFYLLFAEIINTMMTGVNTGESLSDCYYKDYINRFSKNEPK